MVVPVVADLTAIIGCGNPNRTDDGVGPYVIKLLRDRDLPDNVVLFDGGTDGMGVMYQARGCSRLVIIDARIPDGNPGSIYEVPGDILERPPNQSLNLHDFLWDHALFAGRKIYGDAFPQDVTVLLVEAASLDMGLELTPEIERAAGAVAQRIEDLCN